MKKTKFIFNHSGRGVPARAAVAVTVVKAAGIAQGFTIVALWTLWAG